MLFRNFRKKNNGSAEGNRNRSGPSILTEDVVIEGNLISGGVSGAGATLLTTVVS